MNASLLTEKLKDIPPELQKYFKNFDPERIITSPPLTLSSCNDYILIKCDWIVDRSLKDIIDRKECFLNLNFVNIALFNYSHPDFLFEFLSMDRAKLPANLVRGDPRCVSVDTIDMTEPLNICLNSKAEAKQIIESINSTS